VVTWCCTACYPSIVDISEERTRFIPEGKEDMMVLWDGDEDVIWMKVYNIIPTQRVFRRTSSRVENPPSQV
jgi:hypothetical protein